VLVSRSRGAEEVQQRCRDAGGAEGQRGQRGGCRGADAVIVH